MKKIISDITRDLYRNQYKKKRRRKKGGVMWRARDGNCMFNKIE